MSETPTRLSSGHALQLEFFETGSFRRRVDGWVHRKTVPYAIVAQPVAGSYAVRRNGRRETVTEGRVLYVPAHTPVEFGHHDGAGGLMEARWVHLHWSRWGMEDFLARYDASLLLEKSDGEEAGRLIGEALALNRLRDDDAGRLLGQHAVAARIAALLCRGRTAVVGPRREQLVPVLAHIRDRLAEPLSVDGLAERAGLSPARFHAVFKEEFGVTPMNYVRAARLEAAARLLVSTEMKLAVVAEATGFSDAFHLSHVFKEDYGVSPSEYRRRAAKLQP
ncbi:MAG: AraC family transcriptional regulator [Rariglobus sp.]|nr:AraC family transcriptional regulator [Rariglobus sp.]